MNKKEKNAKEVAYLRKISEEAKKVNKKLEEDLRKIIRSGESLSNYELWLNEKCEIFVQPMFIIETKTKNMEEAGFAADTVYVIMKKA